MTSPGRARADEGVPGRNRQFCRSGRSTPCPPFVRRCSDSPTLCLQSHEGPYGHGAPTRTDQRTRAMQGALVRGDITVQQSFAVVCGYGYVPLSLALRTIFPDWAHYPTIETTIPIRTDSFLYLRCNCVSGSLYSSIRSNRRPSSTLRTRLDQEYRHRAEAHRRSYGGSFLVFVDYARGSLLCKSARHSLQSPDSDSLGIFA